MKLSHRELAGRFQALQELGARFAPTTPADMKVARLLRPISRAWEPLVIERSKIANRIIREALEHRGVEALEDLPASVQRLVNNDVAIAQAAWELEEVDLELPVLQLTQNDLPKERAGTDGWKNGAGLGGIVAELGEMFEYPKD